MAPESYGNLDVEQPICMIGEASTELGTGDWPVWTKEQVGLRSIGGLSAMEIFLPYDNEGSDEGKIGDP